MKYAIVIERALNGYSAYVPDLPGCVAAADSYENAEKLIRQAADGALLHGSRSFVRHFGPILADKLLR